MMRIVIVTIFPGMFDSPFAYGMVKRAQQKGLVEIEVVDLRDFTEDKHRKVDDEPYGGGQGMVLKPEPIFKAVEAVRRSTEPRKSAVVLLSPQGKRLDQKEVVRLSGKEELILICGRYEGVDERVREGLITDEISIGDYVISGGEVAAMVLVEAVVRLIPGVVGDEQSVREESFITGLLDYPSYTRPPSFRGMDVPSVLLSGNHEEIRRWRRRKALEKTLSKRPDLIDKARLDEESKEILSELIGEQVGKIEGERQ